MKHIISITLIMLTTVGCATNQKQITGVVLPTSAGHYLPLSNDGIPSGGWKPSEAIIKKAQPVILEYIKNSDEKIFKNLDQYRCQYFGIIINGKRRIYCNFFWLPEYGENWRSNPVIVDDGGNWYFQLEYDIETGNCLNFSVNGEA